MKRTFKGVMPAPMRTILAGLCADRWARHAGATRAQSRQQPFAPADLLPVYRDPRARRNARRARQETAA